MFCLFAAEPWDTMTERIHGSFPGGPRRAQYAQPLDRTPRLERVAHLEDRVSRGRRARDQKRRLHRITLGFLLAMAAAGAIGGAVGFASHTTPEELTAEQEALGRQDQFISKEVNRTLLELWKMEDVEALRNKGLTR